MDGALDLLDRLNGSAPMVMLTNGLSSVQRPRFARTGMANWFVDYVISEEVGVQKPDSEVFRIALERAGVPTDGNGADRPHDRHADTSPPAIMIGDNLNSDMRGALDAGLDACWVNLRGRENTSGVEPTFTVTALAEIPDLLGL